MQIETVSTDDLDDVSALQPVDWTDIIPHIKYYIASDFCYPVKVVQDNKIIGTGTTINLEYTAWLAHIIVDMSFRGRGIGFQLVDELIRICGRQNEKSILLTATQLGEPLYKKHGFRPVSDYIFFTRQKPWNPYPVSLSIIPYVSRYNAEIYEMDRKITGENRVKILRTFLKTSLLFVRGNVVRGCYFPDLGEGMIIADTHEAGIELMKLKYATADKAVLPAENTLGIDFLVENGFTETSRCKRMILGTDISWKPECIFSRIGGNFG
jgi:GNAT superfamily N-acetyltransferase